MPTENRSSNTEQMVPAAPGPLAESIADVEAWLADDSDPGSISITQRESIDLVLYELKRLRLPSIEQHQGEPVGYRWNHLGMGWRYGETLPAIIVGTWQELYSQPGADEVMHLRCEVSKWRGTAGRLTHERDEARAQLVERDALIGHMAYYLSSALSSHQHSMSEETMHHALSLLNDWRQLQSKPASASAAPEVKS